MSRHDSWLYPSGIPPATVAARSFEAASVSVSSPPEAESGAASALDSVKLERKGITSHAKQLAFRLLRTVERDQVVKLLDDHHAHEIADRIRECSSRIITATCKSCSKVKTFVNHCDNFWCPCCLDRAASRKKKAVEWWTHQVQQPKHVVLTSRNTDTITTAELRRLKKALASLRRSKFARNWKGGFYSIEVTNEGKGWHIHFHLLVDARWIDSAQLAQEWGKRVGQTFAVVKVKDCRKADYLREVAKYAVKPTDMLKWDGWQMIDFITAFDSVRTFGVFGTCFGKNAEWLRHCETLLTDKRTCECGCREFTYFDQVNPDFQAHSTNAPPPPEAVKLIPADHPVLPGLAAYERSVTSAAAIAR